MSAPADDLSARIHREGPIAFDGFVDAALYGEGGFFSRARGAGRAGRDFVTSPEVGSLYGALVARALDRWWHELERPDPFFVVEAGAGRGRLCTDVLAAAPECAAALRYVLVERSAELRAAQRDLLALEPYEDALGPMIPGDEDVAAIPVTGLGPIVTALDQLPAIPLTGVVLANELLDNLPFRVVERANDRWLEVRVAYEGSEFVEVLVPASDEVAAEADAVAAGPVPVGARLPVPTGLRDWVRECASVLRRGVLVVIDYAAPGEELVARRMSGWLRTYREHDRGQPPLVAPGEQDITVDVPVEYLVGVAARAGLELVRDIPQSEWLTELGIHELTAHARAQWDARAHLGDLEALGHRSRVGEATALVDPTGLGAHRVMTFRAAG